MKPTKIAEKEAIKLTKTVIDKIVPPPEGQAFHRDDELKGFALRVTASGVKSFIVETRIDGTVKRMTIGRYGPLTVEQARTEAQKVLGKIATGTNPVTEKRERRVKGVTLEQVFQDFLKTRKNLKPKTIYDYQRVMEIAFSDWKKKPILTISKDAIGKRHEALGNERGKAYANLSMRVLRALFNFAAGQYEDANGRSLVLENPVKRLSQTKAWYRVDRRRSYIKPHELPAWLKAVHALDNPTLRDYLLLVLFTGLRREEASRLTWADIDLKGRTLTLLDTKNREPHILPLSDFLHDMLVRRKAASDSLFVFPGTGKGGYIVEPRRQAGKVSQASGVKFTVHDLRRTFITTAESLDVPAYALKRLLNHKMSGDVTAGYIITDVERLRAPMQKITDAILRAAEERHEPAKVIALRR